MSIQVRDLITRLQQIPDQSAQVFIAAKIHGGEDVVELPLDFPDIRPWNPAKVHIQLDSDQVEESIIKEHRAYIDLEEKVEDLQEALASIRREVNSVTDPD